MTEKEKMLAGELYDPSDEELAKAHTRAQELCVEYNGLKQSDERRKAVLAELMPGLGKDSYVQGPIWTDYGTNITTGECFYANFNLTILDCGEIRIGNNVMFGPNVSLYAAYHPLDYKRRNMRRREDGTLYDLEYGSRITICDNCWLGGGVTVLPRVTIGEGSVIGAGSVVTKDIPAHSLAVGNPCRVIKML